MWTVWDLKPHRKEGGESVDGPEELDEPPAKNVVAGLQAVVCGGWRAPSPTPGRDLRDPREMSSGGGLKLPYPQIWPELKGSGQGSRVRRRDFRYRRVLLNFGRYCGHGMHE